MQYARFLAFRCQDPNRSFEILKEASTKVRGSKLFYLNYVNFLKHLEGRLDDVYTKVCQIFDKAIDEGVNGGGLSLVDRIDLSKYYFEYV